MQIASRIIPGSLSFFRSQVDNPGRKVACAVAGLALGSFSVGYRNLSSPQTAFAAGDESLIQHAIDEVVNHVIWDKVGSVLDLGHLATGVLAGLFTFQSLGEKDVVYIPQPICRPIVTKGINPNTGKLEDCMILANGKKLYGREILDFFQSLQYLQFVPGENKGVFK